MPINGMKLEWFLNTQTHDYYILYVCLQPHWHVTMPLGDHALTYVT